jgi:glutaredoxin
MPRLNRQNIDRRTNKPEPNRVESLHGDRLLDRSAQIRRDDDVLRSNHRTLYDIDYAIKWYIENEIQPQIIANQETITVPVIFAAGEKWDNVQRLGYMRDEKGMLQSPIIVLKRNNVTERDSVRKLDVNWPQSANQIIHRQRYNASNRYEDELFPLPIQQPANSQEIYVIDIPRYVTVEYDLMMWCDFTTQMNDLIDQIFPYSRFAWGNEGNKYTTSLGGISTETVNTTGEDRLVRATIPLTVQGSLLAAQITRLETVKKMYSVKKVSFDAVVDVGDLNIFSTTQIPQAVLQQSSQVISGGSVVVSGGGSSTTINAAIMLYLINLTEKPGIYVSGTTITINALAAINPNNLTVATVNEFDIYINGQYVDKAAYTWTPSDVTTQTITFNTALLGYGIDPTDTVIIKGRWQ